MLFPSLSLALFLTVISFIPFNSAQQSCPTPNGRFPHPTQCDAYTECEDGVAEEKLCPDGLLFNSKSRYYAYPCQYPIDVDCEGRTALQTPRANEDCPHSYGYFRANEENKECGRFINCVEGRAFLFDCPEGLAFNENTLQCDWPDQVASCDAEAFLGFQCPLDDVYGIIKYKSAEDCGKYFICINGRPRLQVCPTGYAFDEGKQLCQKSDSNNGCINRSKER